MDLEPTFYPDEDSPLKPRCFLAIPYSPRFRKVREAAREAVHRSKLGLIDLDDMSFSSGVIYERLTDTLLRVDCIIADLSSQNSNVFFEIGLARAMGKGLFLLVEEGERVPSDLHGFQIFSYDPKRLDELIPTLVEALERFSRFPRRVTSVGSIRFSPDFLVDWDRLDRSEAENLCRELLVQMGYRRVDWSKRRREFDLVAELPKKDPDGFEYNEVWLISLGRNAPVEMFIDMASEPDFISYILRDDELSLFRSRDFSYVTILLILLDDMEGRISLERRLTSRIERRSRKSSYNIRVRVWDRDYLTSLVQQFPQVGYKYFSDERRSEAKYRKTPEELYQENVALAERQASLIADLTEEKNKRVRAERDAVWKDISFSAAHKIGNPIFAIETNLDPLQKRVSENRSHEALEVISRIRVSVEKAKGIVDQFKSLTRAQEIKPISMLLRPALEDACKTAREKDVICEIECPEDLRILADPERLSECLDELVANALHWFDKPDKRIKVQVSQPASPLLPGLDSGREYTLIKFCDNGSGVELANKSKIFDAFFTTQDHGTGLGLALVRRIIEGHGGTVRETGVPGEGAEVQIYWPTDGVKATGSKKPTPGRRRRKKE